MCRESWRISVDARAPVPWSPGMCTGRCGSTSAGRSGSVARGTSTVTCSAAERVYLAGRAGSTTTRSPGRSWLMRPACSTLSLPRTSTSTWCQPASAGPACRAVRTHWPAGDFISVSRSGPIAAAPAFMLGCEPIVSGAWPDLGLGWRGQDGDMVPGGRLGQGILVRRSRGGRGPGERLGRLADRGGELLEAGRDVQGEEPRGGGGDDVGVAEAPGQQRDGAGPRSVVLLAHDHPQVAVEHEDGLVFAVVDVHRAAVAAPVEVVGQGEGARGLLAAEAHLGQGAQEPDGRLGVRAGDHAAGYGGDEAGHGRAPFRGWRALAGRRAWVQPTVPE